MNFSFGILKPDCLFRGLENKILKVIEKNGIEIIAQKRLQLTNMNVKKVYSNCLEELFWSDLLDSFLEGDSIVFIACGENVIDNLNRLVGEREPKDADRRSIRYRFGTTVQYNIIHSTATSKTFWNEVEIFFSQRELFSLGITE